MAVGTASIPGFEVADRIERAFPGAIIEAKGSTPEEFARFIAAESAKWSKVIAQSGAKAE